MKRIICLGISVLLVVILFAGCGLTKKSNVGNDTNNNTNKTATTVEKKEKEPITLIWYKGLWDTPVDNPGDVPLSEEIKKKFNIDIKIVGPKNPTNAMEKFWVMIAAGEQIDMANVNLDEPDGSRLKKEDVIIPLNGLLKNYGQNILKNMSSENMEGSKDIEGKIWGINREANPCIAIVPGIQMSILQKHNLKIPETIEEFESYLKLAREENLQPLTALAYQGLNSQESLNSAFAGCFLPIPGGNLGDTGDVSHYLTADGKVAPWFTHEKMKDFLTVMQSWYKNGLINKDFAVINYDQFISAFHTGKSIAVLNLYGNFAEVENLDLPAGKEQVSNFKPLFYTPVKTPKGPEGYHLIKGKGYALWASHVILKMCKYPERAMEFMDFDIGTIEGWNLATMGIEGINFNFTTIDGKKVFSQIKGKEPSWYFYSVPLNKVVWNLEAAWNYPYYYDLEEFSHSLDLTNSSDYKVKYDANNFKSKDKFTDMSTLLSEAETKIIMGVKPVSYWDDAMAKWRKTGGDQYIEDLTAQYNASPVK